MSPSVRRNWTETETRLAMRLYFELPFGKLHQRQSDIIALAAQLGRSPSSVAMKLVNFASLDPSVTGTGRHGLANNSKLDRKVWDEFQANWSIMVEATDEAATAEGSASDSVAEYTLPRTSLTAEQSEQITLIKSRRGQEFFRRAVLANFNIQCCITGIAEPALLVASHIIPWKSDEQNRLNPRNGLALSATFDRAFDQGLITIREDMTLMVGQRLLGHKSSPTREMFAKFDGRPISTPKKLSLDAAAIEFHHRWARSINEYR